MAPQLGVETQTGELSTEPMKKAASSCIPGAAGFSACGTFWMPNAPDFATLMAVGMKEVVCMAAYNTLSEGAVLEEERAGHPGSGPGAEETTRVRLLTERHLIDVSSLQDKRRKLQHSRR